MMIRKRRRRSANVADGSSSNVAAESGRRLDGDILSTIDNRPSIDNTPPSNSQDTPPRQETTSGASLLEDVMNLDLQPSTPLPTPLTPPTTPLNHFHEWLTGN